MRTSSASEEGGAGADVLQAEARHGNGGSALAMEKNRNRGWEIVSAWKIEKLSQSKRHSSPPPSPPPSPPHQPASSPSFHLFSPALSEPPLRQAEEIIETSRVDQHGNSPFDLDPPQVCGPRDLTSSPGNQCTPGTNQGEEDDLVVEDESGSSEEDYIEEIFWPALGNT
jgi:hypothetical protein